MQKHLVNGIGSSIVAAMLLAVGSAYAQEEKPFGATDPFRPYDQRTVPSSDITPYHEGLYLHADVGISLLQDTSEIKAKPGARFSIGPGYTLHSEPAYEVGAQFETGLIYNPVRTDLLTAGGVIERRSANLFQVPFLVDIIYGFHVAPNLIPYVGIGGGGVYRDIDSSAVGSIHSTDPAFQVLAGLRFQLNDVQEVGFGYKFLDAFSGQSDLRSHSLSVAWVLRF
jgi:opacity protein-like surface antigen